MTEMNKEFKPCETKKCSIDNLHPNWMNQELADNMIINEKQQKQTWQQEQYCTKKKHH